MSCERRVGRARFTLTEVLVLALLVVLLASVLAPAFGRPWRPRRKGDNCIGNMRQIAVALQMYLTDTDDRLPPSEHRPEVQAYFNTAPGGGWSFEDCPRARQANPYLRWPVILDSYLGDRDLWRCPAARLESPAAFIIGPEDWLSHLQLHQGVWGNGTGFGPCYTAWPAGWGGEVTDSVTQGMAAETGFVQSIGANVEACDLEMRDVDDPRWYVVFADAGYWGEDFGTGVLAYPDICALECANSACGWADWEYCTWAVDCGLYDFAPADGSFLLNRKLRLPYARHGGGVNLGFLDGHVKHFRSEQLIKESPSMGDPERGKLRGYGPWAPTSDCIFDPSIPTLY